MVEERLSSGDPRWLEKLLYDRWQRMRRHPDYLKFCETQEFEDGFLILDSLYFLDSPYSDEAKKIQGRFGLGRRIFHPSVDLSPEHVLALDIFPDALAVRTKYQREGISEDELGTRTPIFNNHYIHLEIDVNPNRKKDEILKAVWEQVENAREIIRLDENRLADDKAEKSEKAHFDTRLKCYEVWDRRKKKARFSDIARGMKISEDLAKKNYYRAWELILGQPYDPESFRALVKRQPIHKSQIKKTCENCTDKECHRRLEEDPDRWEPCPDVAGYVNQDQVSYDRKHKFAAEDDIERLAQQKAMEGSRRTAPKPSA
jgi:hypothetical protein